VVFVCVVFSKEIEAEENTAPRDRHTFNYDQEIPTLIRYGSMVSGVTSKTGYVGFIQHEESRSRSTVDIGYNITSFEFYPPPGDARLWSMVGFGFIPLISELASCYLLFHQGEKAEGIAMNSLIVGYSYTYTLRCWFGFGFSAHAGPVYVLKISPWKNREEFERDHQDEYYYTYEEWLAAYEAIGNISGKIGGRMNLKIKLFFLNFSGRTHVGIGAGYTQFVFAENHFNTYDIGLDFTMAW